MKYPRRIRKISSLRSLRRAVAAGGVLLAASLTSVVAHAQINAANWGNVTSPVFGTSEAAPYTGAELFAGPNKFGSYFAGVLPNGRKVTPAGLTVQIGMNTLGTVLTPDGKYLITSNDDERETNLTSLQSPINIGGYSLSVVRTSDMTVVSQINNVGRVFIGMQVKGSGPYTLYASGGADQNIKLFSISAGGAITVGAPANIPVVPSLPQNAGYVSNFTNAAAPTTTYVNSLGTTTNANNFFGGSAKITFPAGSALSPNGRYLYVACNGDNSLAVIDTTTNTVIKQIPVGYFPYGVSVSSDGSKVLVSNWGVTEYKFANPTYDGTGALTNIKSTSNNVPDGFYVPPTSISGTNPKTSSISLISVPGGNPANAALIGSIYEGQPGGIDALYNVGDTHPSATGIVKRGAQEVLYVCKANSDSIGLILVNNNRKLDDFDLSPVKVTLNDGHKIHGAYPNAIVISPDNSRAYVAEAGLNSVAVLDTTVPSAPKLLGRIPTNWYPTALSISSDGKTLYIANAKGVGEDIRTTMNSNVGAGVDSNYIFGTLQKVDLTTGPIDNTTVLNNNFAIHAPADTSIVPAGGSASTKIKHVFFILQENKTFDCELGNQAHFGVYATNTFTLPTGATQTLPQFTGVVPNLQLLANTFAAGVNYFSDAEESDAGHQFVASGTATDYTEKTLLVKSGRGLLVNKNFEPEDYPEGGYLYNNAARNGVSFRLYGLEAARIVGSDTGNSKPTTLNDPLSGLLGYPMLQADNITITNPLVNLGDVDTATSPGVGQSFFMKMPGLAIVGTNNPNGVGRLDMNYPGYNFNISDQRRAKEFCKDFDAMVAAGTLPQFLYIYLPNSHTGGTVGTNLPQPSAQQQVGDSDVALGMVVQHIMNSPVYYNAADGTGSAIFTVPDDAQSSVDHIHQHRSPLVVISPYAKPAYIATKHYSSASIVKTEELLLGLPPNNLGDLFATDLRDMFQPTYNGITIPASTFNRICKYIPSTEGKRIWALVRNLDTSAPDRDSHRLGVLTQLSMQADELHASATKKRHLTAKPYLALQARLYRVALTLVHASAPRDADD